MIIGSFEEYAIRCALQLTRLHAFSKTQSVSAARIAEKENLSVEYVSKILFLLKKKEIVETARGQKGGFYLKKNPKDISLFQLVSAIRNYNVEEACKQHAGQNEICVHIGNCSLKAIWSSLFLVFEQVLAKINLADVAFSTSDLSHKSIEQLANSFSSHIKKSFFYHALQQLFAQIQAYNSYQNIHLPLL